MLFFSVVVAVFLLSVKGLKEKSNVIKIKTSVSFIVITMLSTELSDDKVNYRYIIDVMKHLSV